MFFLFIIPLRAIRPTLFDASLGPYFVYILCHLFYQRFQFFRQLDTAGVYRLRDIFVGCCICRIAGSVLNYFAQTLMFTGSVFGLKVYVDRRLPK